MTRDYARRDILDSMPGTVAELIEKSGYHRATVERWLPKLRAGELEERASHIIDWRRPNGSGKFIPVHGAGPGEDAACPFKPQTSSEDWAKAKAKFGVEMLRRKERARHYALRARRGVTKDPLVEAICRPARDVK